MLQILITILSSSTKFAMTFPLAIIQFDFSFQETILWTNLGGALGIFFFAFLSEKVIGWWRSTFRRKKQNSERTAGKKRFTKKNRRIVRIKQRYGLIGIAITTPVLLSIPVGAFLVTRYYRGNHSKIPLLIASNLLWSVIYTVFYSFWDGLLLKEL